MKIRSLHKIETSYIRCLYVSYLTYKLYKEIDVFKTYDDFLALIQIDFIRKSLSYIGLKVLVVFILILSTLFSYKSLNLSFYNRIDKQINVFRINQYDFTEGNIPILILSPISIFTILITEVSQESRIMINLILCYTIVHDCPRFPTISSTFKRKEDSIIIFIFLLLSALINPKERFDLIQFMLRSFIFIFSTDKSMGASTHTYWTVVYALLYINESKLYAGLCFVTLNLTCNFLISDFVKVYNELCKNDYDSNQYGPIRFYKNLPFYAQKNLSYLCDLCFILELLLLF